jgi:Mn-dependent DtxR family transcriptional regulator
MDSVKFQYTRLQGQYLAFIATYTKLNGRPPAEADIQRYFKVTPPTVHQMILTLEKRSLITRTPGQARSIKVRVPREELPLLD